MRSKLQLSHTEPSQELAGAKEGSKDTAWLPRLPPPTILLNPECQHLPTQETAQITLP